LSQLLAGHIVDVFVSPDTIPLPAGTVSFNHHQAGAVIKKMKNL